MPDPWEAHAKWWQDEFTEGVDPEYTEQIIPLIAEHLPPTGTMLDVGAGEGQIARVAASAALGVVGVDPAWAQVAVGRNRAGGPAYLQGSATSLPVASGSV